MHGIVIKKPDCSLFLLSLTLSLLLPLSGCDSDKEKQPSQPAIQSVTVTAVRKINVAETVERVAQTQATEDIELKARVEGFLVERKFIVLRCTPTGTVGCKVPDMKAPTMRSVPSAPL
jgi:hypothetical protein